MRQFVASVFAVWVLALGGAASVQAADEGTLHIYIDADFSRAWQSSQSIEQGITAAFATQDFEIAGYGLEIIALDHRANARRSIENLRRFDADENAVAVIGGMHSPPYIQHLAEINDREIPLLLAWAAAGILTRDRMGAENSIFRLSVDDARVGPFLAGEMTRSGCLRIGVVVVDNSWGNGNRASIVAALSDMAQPHVYESGLGTDIGAARAREVAAEISAAGVDCLALVGNTGNSAALMLALDEIGVDLRVFSHWGILGWEFADVVPHAARSATELTVVQSCGLDPSRRNGEVLSEALRQAQRFGMGYNSLSDVAAPAGFVHGFDLGLILMAALTQAAQAEGWDNGIQGRRAALRASLENLDYPVAGILRTYTRPFGTVTAANINAHEALAGADLCLARFDENGRLVDRHAAEWDEQGVPVP